MWKSLINKRLPYTSIAGFFAVVIFAVFVFEMIAIKTNDRIDVLDKIIESWNPVETIWRFNAIKGDMPLRIRNVLSRRANYYLSDADLRYLHNAISDSKSWERIFEKIPKKEIGLFQTEQSVIFDDLEVTLILVPSVSGWKIDGLKSVEKFDG